MKTSTIILKSLAVIGFTVLNFGISFSQESNQTNNLVTTAEKKTSFDDAVKALQNQNIGEIFPAYDEQVNQIIRMINKGSQISGSIQALTSLGVYFGGDIDLDEEEIVIKGSKTDVVLYNEICKSLIVDFKKPLNSSINEAGAIVDQLDKGAGKDILKGIKTLSFANYRMRTGVDILVNNKKLELWSKVGQMDPKKFQEVYASMLLLGMQKELNDNNTKSILLLMNENANPDILKAVTSLKAANWICEGELDKREVSVISSLINNKYTEPTKDEIGSKFNPISQLIAK